LRAWLKAHAPESIGEDEIEAHFAAMPSHYWDDVTEEELVWGLHTIHQFLNNTARSDFPPTMPVLDSRPDPGEGGTRLMLCTWDRRGLLAKATACLSAVNLTIQKAHVFTRSDNIVLDLLVISDEDGKSCAPADKLEQMSFLLDGALSNPPRFASVWACSRHIYIDTPTSGAPKISFDNSTSPTSTQLRIEAHDRLGLLYDILQAVADAGLHLKQADITTCGALACDTLHCVDDEGRKVVNRAQLNRIRRALTSAIKANQ